MILVMDKTLKERVILRTSIELKVLLRQRAKIRGLSVGEYIRQVLNRAVRLDWGFEEEATRPSNNT